jgi:hypothetical protein
MMPVQTSSDHFGMNQHLSGLGQGVHQDPAWLAIFQNQSFPGPWNQMPPSIASPVTVSHTGAPSPTSASHVGDGRLFLQTMSTTCPQPLPIMLGAPFFSPRIIAMSRLPPLFIIQEMTLFPLLVTSRSLDVSDVSLNSFAGLVKEVTLLVCV